MHSIKDIRKNFENFKKLIKLRNVNLDFDNILFLDEKNRNLIQEKESLEMEKKNISKNKDEKLFAKSKEISSKIDNLSNQQSLIKNQLNDILSLIPNIPLEDVVDWITSLAPKGIIEFVPKNDVTIQSMLKLKGDIFPNYNLENFKKFLSNKEKITSDSKDGVVGWF